MAEYLKSRGHGVALSDLYSEPFPPLMPLEEISRGGTTDSLVLEHQKNLVKADRLLLFYPDWWGMPPAVLKGWIDRTLATETAYRWEGEDFLEKEWVPLLGEKEAVVFVTADGVLNESWLRELWDGKVFGKCGMSLSLRILDRIRERSYGEIRLWVEEQKASL